MPDNIIRLTRRELYKQAWTQPMSRLAHQYGMPDVALAENRIVVADKLAEPHREVAVAERSLRAGKPDERGHPTHIPQIDYRISSD
jgi:hypothetical protein